MRHWLSRLREWRRHAFTLACLVVPLLGFTAWLSGRDSPVLTSITTVMFIYTVLVVGLQVFMGNSGVANFGQVGFMLIGAYVSILFTLSPAQKSFTLPDMPTGWWIHGVHLPFLPSLLIGACAAAVIGLLMAAPLIPVGGMAFGFGSFAFLVIIRAVALNLDVVTRGARTVVGIDRHTTLWVAAAWAVLSIVAAYLFKESSLGLKLRASREDKRAAASIGINVFWVRMVAWGFGCFLAGIAGALWAHRITTLTPHAFWIPLNFLGLMMLVVGGRASVSGAVLGTVVVTLVSQGVTQAEYWLNINRTVIPGLAALFPEQIVGLREFVLSIVLLLILYLRPAGIMKGYEIVWPFRSKATNETVGESETGRAGALPSSTDGLQVDG